jgi:hypothetical protein
MKLNSHRISVALASIGSALFLLQDVQAATFSYGDRDLILCFRKDNADGFGTVAQSVIEVDIGPAVNYYNAAIGSITTVNQYSTLLGTFDSINDLSWSVSGCVPYPNDGGDQTIPADTLWLTAPRPAAQVLASAWVSEGANVQAQTVNKIASIQFNAAQYGTTVASGPENSASVIVIPVGNTPDFSCDPFLGDASPNIGNFNGKFQGNVETTTPPDFTSGNELPSRADLYQLEPSASRTPPAGTYLGYFELEPNGTMVFYRLAGPPPTITVTRSGTTSTISFASVAGATYTLYCTNAPGVLAPISAWTTVSGNISGDGTVKSFQVTGTSANQFFSVQEH